MGKHPQFETPEAEVQYVYERIRQRHEEAERERPNERQPKETVKQVVGEHIQAVQLGASPLDDSALNNLGDDKEQVRELIGIAFSRGITEAVKVARALKNPHALDDFHDALTDHFYEKLLASGIIRKEI